MELCLFFLNLFIFFTKEPVVDLYLVSAQFSFKTT